MMKNRQPKARPLVKQHKVKAKRNKYTSTPNNVRYIKAVVETE